MVDLVNELASTASEVVRKQVARALSWAPWIHAEPTRDDRTLLVVGAGRPPLVEQLRSLLGRTNPASAVVLSASFDRKLEAVKKLADLTSQGRVRCIIQPDVVDLDGKAVAKIRRIAQWYPFVDPYPREKRKRKDVRAHAKLIVFNCGSRELVVYGSANCSKPALLDEEVNTEVVVAFWHAGKKSFLELLGLDNSLNQARIDGELVRKAWHGDDEHRGSYQCVLSGAVMYGRRIELAISEGKPPDDALVEIAESVNRVPLTKAPIRQREAGRFEAAAAASEDMRVARLVTRGGRPVSNFVAFTSPELAEVRGRSSIGSRADAAIAAISMAKPQPPTRNSPGEFVRTVVRIYVQTPFQISFDAHCPTVISTLQLVTPALMVQVPGLSLGKVRPTLQPICVPAASSASAIFPLKSAVCEDCAGVPPVTSTLIDPVHIVPLGALKPTDTVKFPWVGVGTGVEEPPPGGHPSTPRRLIRSKSRNQIFLF